ncbi:MAG: F0F1 ATP synthase subunit gamma [Rothia sp. (in: high G+C Gram-positive bacteria)]|uniref:F0F1 ATP synthase subunit gamma n=1 Tax=Rothia sp. (in: high G+C Gram-positive bacteria) TaxID=1885016 RepID=UPI0026E0B103|nr:F0F1 ATP synthase subunit gamma [Rothia sp. (in: high G+C Gram-positive bacteria)]MDO5750779.1 F0F1 ATP synthase subunit gamma [Rothia sp. (in: high G+C Gram-positive bacteria)]
MGAQIRVYRQKIASTSSMKKIFKAMEMIATSRINKARRSAQTASPYANALTRAVTAVATQRNVEHPLIHRPGTFGTHEHKRSAVLVLTSDRGLAGSYSSSILKKTEELIEKLREEGREVSLYLVGRKAKSYFDFRERAYEQAWEGNTDNPRVDTASEIRDVLLEAYTTSFEDGGVDDLHIVYTEFVSMVTQEAKILRLLPIHVGEATKLGEEIVPGEQLQESDYTQEAAFTFEPSAQEVLDELLPRYIASRIYACLLEAAASELASRQRAMKTAGDNAESLIKKYTLLMNNARQAEITQELSEIVGGAAALGS